MDYDILPTDEFRAVENRRYLNPSLPVTETENFITNFRENQRANNAQIAQQTQRLGTNVPSNLGGLIGAGSYFTSRYQTPQTNAAMQNLRTAAQASALNQALANEQAMWKKRYQDAYNAYQKRQNDKANAGPDTTTEGASDTKDNSYTIEGETPGVSGYYTVAQIDTDNGTVLGTIGVPYGEEGRTNYSSNLTYSRVPTTLVNVREGKIGATTPSGQKIWANSGSESIMRGSDGAYYIYNKSNGTYTYAGE